jgi:hypothetical protein
MYNLRMVAISGPAGRGSFFGGAVSDGFRAGHALSGDYSLGQTPEEWYRRAKSAIADFDGYAARTAKIANKTVRDQIATDYGLNDPANKDKAAYMRAAVAYNVGQAESYTPPNYLIFGVGQQAKNRVQALENLNSDFRRAVSDAENTYGTLPAPVVIERLVPGASAPVNWTLPVVIGGGAVVLAAALGLFGGGK